MSKTTKDKRDFIRDYYAPDSISIEILDDLEAAEAEIARLREQTRWRPIDMAPKERCTKMLLYDSGVEIGWWDGVWIGLDGYRIEPTYCMPLPLSPQAQESERE